MRKSPLKSIKKTVDFKNVYKFGRSFTGRYFVIYTYPNGKSYARLGLSIGKKVGKAVVRNKLRRWIKEYFRLSEHGLAGSDVVVIAKVKANELVSTGKFSDVEKSIANLVEQIR